MIHLFLLGRKIKLSRPYLHCLSTNVDVFSSEQLLRVINVASLTNVEIDNFQNICHHQTIGVIFVRHHKSQADSSPFSDVIHLLVDFISFPYKVFLVNYCPLELFPLMIFCWNLVNKPICFSRIPGSRRVHMPVCFSINISVCQPVPTLHTVEQVSHSLCCLVYGSVLLERGIGL